MSTKKTDLGGKTPLRGPGHMRQNAYYRNLKWTFEGYCRVIVTQ